MPIYSLEGKTPSLPPPGRFWVAPDANVIGDVELGEDVGIWFGAALRGDNRADSDRRAQQRPGGVRAAHRHRLSP